MRVYNVDEIDTRNATCYYKKHLGVEKNGEKETVRTSKWGKPTIKIIFKIFETLTALRLTI